MNSGLNKDQIKGSAKDIGGKIQEEAGKSVGSKEQQIKGWRSRRKERSSNRLEI